MGLNGIDFLSSEPKAFIFGRNSNKTNLGGVLSLIYLIIFVLITISYLFYYFIQDDYAIQYLYYENLLSPLENEKMIESDKYNPKFDFDINVYQGYNSAKIINESRVKIIDIYNYNIKYIPLSGKVRKKITEIDWFIAYDCLGENIETCQNSIDGKELSLSGLEIEMNFEGFKFDHQNESSAFHKQDNGDFYTHRYKFNFLNPQERTTTWSLVKYREDKGILSIFGNKKENKDEDYEIGITTKSFEWNSMMEYNEKYYIIYYSYEDKFFIIAGRLSFQINYNHYDQFQRTKKSIFNTIAKICSLCISIFNGFTFVFVKFYSNNFDNYKIIEKILFNSDKRKTNKKPDTIINSKNAFSKSYYLNNIDNIDKQNLIINDENSCKLDDNEDDDNLDIYKDSFEKSKTKKLPTLRFIDFFCNNIYGRKCCNLNRQEIISKCNEIISKYYSIENILYNQMILENLLKDYKWNNPEVNDINNNELIIQLKNLIYSYKIK